MVKTNAHILAEVVGTAKTSVIKKVLKEMDNGTTLEDVMQAIWEIQNEQE